MKLCAYISAGMKEEESSLLGLHYKREINEVAPSPREVISYHVENL